MKRAAPRLILASASPRRQEILTSLGVAFEVVVPECEEIHNPDAPAVTVMENARRKALAVHKLHPEAYIIAADTVVSFKGRSLGKPTSEVEGKAWLLSYSGARQQVYTAVAFLAPEDEAPQCFTEVSALLFHPYSRETVEAYWEKVNPIDRAGAYDINTCGEMLIAERKGSYTNVMGLPRALVKLWLKAKSIQA